MVASREVVPRLPVTIRVGEAARVNTFSIYRLIVDARRNVDALLSIYGWCLMIVVMMFHDLAVDDWRPFVGFSFCRIRAEISGQCGTSEPKKRCSHEKEAVHCILRMR